MKYKNFGGGCFVKCLDRYFINYKIEKLKNSINFFLQIFQNIIKYITHIF